MSNNSGWLVPLERLENARHCGAKAYNLGRLARASYPVPCGIAILDAAMQRHLVESGVLNDCHALLVEFRGLEASEVRKRASSIRSRILKTPLSAELRADIAQNYNESWSGKRLAVRSSGICEDTKQASFAGQFDSVLDVDTQERLEIAILTVWASLWSDRCLLYARRKGLNDARMGVVIQEMVDAQYSGVLFSRDPCATGTSEEVVIEYTCGLGDLLAAGQTTPGRARVCHQSLSLTHEDTGAEEPCSTMPDATLRELARIGLDLERKFENELCRATVADLRWDEDGERGTIVLEKHKTAKKTGKPRLIPVGKRLAELIRESLGDRTEGPLFLRPNGKPWTTQTLSSNFRRLRQKAGLPDDLCLYLTRHEHGTVITEKFGIKAAADALGHSNIQTTMRYAKRDLSGMKDRQDAFGESEDPPPTAEAA